MLKVREGEKGEGLLHQQSLGAASDHGEGKVKGREKGGGL